MNRSYSCTGRGSRQVWCIGFGAQFLESNACLTQRTHGFGAQDVRALRQHHAGRMSQQDGQCLCLLSFRQADRLFHECPPIAISSRHQSTVKANEHQYTSREMPGALDALPPDVKVIWIWPAQCVVGFPGEIRTLVKAASS